MAKYFPKHDFLPITELTKKKGISLDTMLPLCLCFSSYKKEG